MTLALGSDPQARGSVQSRRVNSPRQPRTPREAWARKQTPCVPVSCGEEDDDGASERLAAELLRGFSAGTQSHQVVRLQRAEGWRRRDQGQGRFQAAHGEGLAREGAGTGSVKAGVTLQLSRPAALAPQVSVCPWPRSSCTPTLAAAARADRPGQRTAAECQAGARCRWVSHAPRHVRCRPWAPRRPGSCSGRQWRSRTPAPVLRSHPLPLRWAACGQTKQSPPRETLRCSAQP